MKEGKQLRARDVEKKGFFASPKQSNAGRGNPTAPTAARGFAMPPPQSSETRLRNSPVFTDLNLFRKRGQTPVELPASASETIALLSSQIEKLRSENARLTALSSDHSSQIEKLRSENARLTELCAVDVVDCTGETVVATEGIPFAKRQRADVSGLKAMADAVIGVGEVTREVKIERDAAKTARDEAQRKLECPLCMDADISVCFLPCRHLLCGECGANVGTCPTCSTAIESRVSIFLP